jgi:hypothetical protein
MRKYFGLLAVTGLVTLPAVSLAAAPSLSEVLGSSGISAQGVVSGGYTYGFNKGQTLLGHAFDQDANSFALNQADLALSYTPTTGVGGLVEVLAGNDARFVNNALTGSSGSTNDFSLPQAYLQYATGNLTVIGGRYWTLSGAEVANDSKNTNISRSFLYVEAEPFLHTGVRGTYKFSDTLSGNLGVANSAASSTPQDGDKTKTVEANVTFAPNASSSFAVTDYYGVDSNPIFVPGTTGSVEARSNYLDGVASFPIVGNLSMVLNLDWAQLIPVNSDVGTLGIYGAAGYLNYGFNDSWKASLRGEYLKSHGGFLTCYDQTDGKCKLTEVTATVDYSAAKNLDLLAEVRFDMGSQVYPDPGSDTTNGSDFASHQGSLAVKAIYKFGTPTT